MVGFRNTVVGSYPRPEKLEDTMKRPVMTQEEVDDYIKWAAKDQAELGLDTITDGEGYRENMYYFYQKRIDGITFEDMPKVSFGTAGFGIECPRVIGELKNPRFDIARNWKIARDAAPADVDVKLTVTGPHVLYRFSVNEREDLYPDAQSLCRAWAHVLRDEIAEAIALGCEPVQFDEPMWTESPEESVWAAEILAELIASLPKKVRIGLHVCGGNPRRKRVYFTKYTDIVDAFKAVPVDELLLEHCTLSYNMLELFDQWDFKGDLAIGVIDQRSDELESVEEIRQRIKPALDYFPADRLILTSECGFGHVPIDVTHAKLKRLVEASKVL